MADLKLNTEWNKWENLMEDGYECFAKRKPEQGLSFWDDAWKIFCDIMEQNQETDTLYGLMDTLDYRYPVDGWLQDYEMELGNAAKYEERLTFCQKVLEIFDWQEADDSCFRCGIGESLYRDGRAAEAYEYYEKWLDEDPQNVNGTSSYSWILYESGDVDKAYEVIKRLTEDISCNEENRFLFMRRQELAQELGKEEESTRKQKPSVKEKKIYPNDPCPCGSGKKYKKCCGRR